MKRPDTLRDEARDEAYTYFDKMIRPLPKTSDGKIDTEGSGLSDNDVDAFRHAYVSGVFTQEYGEKAAEIFGLLNEWSPLDLYSNTRNPGGKNMDLWNNAIGRQCGLKAKDRKELLEAVHNALKNGELIVSPDDKRDYKGSTRYSINSIKPIIVIRQSKDGRNEVFFDTKKRLVMSVDEFVFAIESGTYPEYTVKMISGQKTPVSKPDDQEFNNLG